VLARWGGGGPPQVPKATVSIGDAFTRVGSRTVYVVESLVEGSDMPPHARIVAAPPAHEGPILMSISALTDPNFYVRVSRVK
jgi:hypothetical protein